MFWKVKLCLDVSNVMHANELKKRLIVANLRIANLHKNANFVLWWERIILKKSYYFGLRCPLMKFFKPL